MAIWTSALAQQQHSMVVLQAVLPADSKLATHSKLEPQSAHVDCRIASPFLERA
jgi:hypothetical protein